jgi:integrase
MTVFFAGLRSSELRGLRWEDVDLVKAELQIRQRLDRFNKSDVPKSTAGERTIPMPPMLVSALRVWKVKCPPGPQGLVFPNGAGRPENRANIVARGWIPAQIAAGVSTIVKDADGKVALDAKGEPVRKEKYGGLHAGRHFYASWCINRKVDGGLELPAKMVQTRMGHSSIVMTLDVYGHLFPSGDDGAEMAAAEKYFLT